MNIRAKRLVPAVFCLLAGSAAPTNIVQNPGFEQAAADWDDEHFALGPGPLWAHTGPGMARLSYCANDACLGTLFGGAYLGQLLATTAGGHYALSFWVSSFAGDSRLSVFWDGALLTEMGTPNGPMLQSSFSGLVASANATLLQVHGYNSLNQHMSFDDVSVVRVGEAPAMAPLEPVTEPAAWALLLAALATLALVRRRPS